MRREEMLDLVLNRGRPFDFVIIGGGATGIGVAIDAASRGYQTLLVEQSDFGKGTSSRSTKLVHGGVRYLQQGNVPLVMEALKERGILRANAPHLVSDLRFVVPSYDWWEAPFYGIGLKIYDLLAGQYGFGPSEHLTRAETLTHIPTLKTDGLRGGTLYHDGQFDDARLLIHMARTAVEQGASLLNHTAVVRLRKDAKGYVDGVEIRDALSGVEASIRARAVIAAAGPFTDAVLRLDDRAARSLIAPSQGVHIVLDRKFLPGDAAIMVPHTSDGRVMFAIPWHGHAVVGTTDTPIDDVPLEPRPRADEIDFILETAGDYLSQRPGRSDIQSAFAGIRPLVKVGDGGPTAGLSRDHTIHITDSGMIAICGGKWTTYRAMAEDCVNHAATIARLDERACVTRSLRIHGYHARPEELGPLAPYGSDAAAIAELIVARPELAVPLHTRLPYVEAEVVFAARVELARTIDDVLARRTRALFLDARAALDMAPRVAELMAAELGRDEAWVAAELQAFAAIVAGYIVDI